MPVAFRIALIFLFFAANCLTLLSAQNEKAVQPSQTRPSTAAISYKAMPDQNRETSHLVTLTDQALSASEPQNIGYQLIITCNTESYDGYLGPRVDGINAYTSTNPGLRSFKGKTVQLKDLDVGTYTISFHQDGYDDLSLQLTIVAGHQYRMDIQLIPRSGMLDISGDQSLQIVEIDGQVTSSPFPLILPEGRHRVRVRSFAFEDYFQSVVINQNLVTILDIQFAPAVFRLSNVSISRPRFRPSNVGSLGTSTLFFDVSSFGAANIAITNPEGKVVLSKNMTDFTTWTQKFTWDGRDDTGLQLPEGTYAWVVSSQPLDGVDGKTQTAKGTLIIDDSSYIKYRSQWSGPSGLDFVSDAYTLAPTAFQIGSRLAMLSAGVAPATTSKFLVAMDFRYGIYQNIELWANAAGDIELAGSSSSLGIIGGGLAWAVIPLPGSKSEQSGSTVDFGLKLNLSGAGLLFSSVRYPYDLDETGVIPGGRFGIAAQVRWGLFSLLLEPVIHLSAWPFHLEQGDSATTNQLPTANANFFASLHGGLYFDLERLVVGISAAIYSSPSFGFQLPVRTGVNIQVMPVEGFLLGLDFQIKLGSPNHLEPSGGLSIGFVQ